MEIVSIIILMVVVCLAVLVSFVFVCLEAEYRRAIREKRDALRRKRRAAKEFPIDHGYGRRAA
jgi:hypothetical protein